MSVQVRRRREGAAFLQTFVGAGGELLVDTTNNRVQVHDGVTPGGFPAAAVGDLPGRNALVNGSFAINQRGYASGASLAAGAYAHDRWKAGTAGAYTFAPAVPDTVLTVTSGTLVQAVEPSNVHAAAWWLTWTGTAAARVWQGAAGGAFSAGTRVAVGGVAVNALLVTGLTPGTVANVEFATGTLGLVQFEAALPGAGPTRFERRHPSVEQRLCSSYYQVLGKGSTYYKYGFGFGNGGSVPVGVLGFQPMRATPTFAATGSFTLQGGGAYGTITGIAFDQGNASGCSVSVQVSGTGSGFYLLQDGGTGASSFLFSAEL